MGTHEDVRRVRVVLDGFALDKEGAELTVHAADSSGKIIQSVPVGQTGPFHLVSESLTFPSPVCI